MDNQTREFIEGGKCTVSEAATLLSSSRWQVYEMIRHGDLIAWTPYSRSRKQLLYRKQVESLAATRQAEAIKRARRASEQMQLALGIV